MKQIFLSFILLLTSIATFAGEPILFAWVAARVGDKMYTNMDVEDFITRAQLSDMEKTVLFKRANKDYGQYLALKKQRIYENNKEIYNKGLKKLVYQEMVKQHAIREMRSNSSRSRRSGGPLGLGNLFGGGNRSEPVDNNRRAFNITEDQFFKMVQEKEDKVLKVWLDQRLGIVKARQEFGDQLKKSDYPHKASDSNEDVYWRWYKSMKNALKQEMLSQEVQKWEAIQATKRNPTMHIRPADVYDFHKETGSYINEKINNQDMSYKDWTGLISSKPEISVLMEDTKILSLGGASPFSIMESDQAKFEQLKKEIQTSFLPQLGNELIGKIIDYEKKAQVLADKYPTVESLVALYEEHDRRADDRSLMLAKLYKMAATIKEGNADRVKTQRLITTAFSSAINELKSLLMNNATYQKEENQKLLFHMVVEAELKRMTQDSASEDDLYSKRTLNMAIWFTKFLANKSAFSTNVRIKTNICAYNTFECQKKITDWLKMQEFQNGVEYFRTKELRNEHQGFVSLNPDGKSELYGDQALDFILK
ncbi:MAG: hypothetical protein EP319_14145 [Deltaproteobacteria bacterium]|nr:MAG: hypothetical protein EP319_14145 [Deltaproteobacteria bacterium]